MVTVLSPVYLRESDITWRGLRLMEHQARALGALSEPRLLIEAPTGGGKTWTAAAPLIEAVDRGEGAIFVYPTNALADDQERSLCDLGQRAGCPVGIVQGDGSYTGGPSAHVLVCRIHAGMLDDVQLNLGGRFRGQQLSRLLQQLPPKPVWFVTNPDTLYLLITARYAFAPQLWSRLEPCRTLVLDEFHLYRGPALVRALCLIELARPLLRVDRVRILSATLPTKTRELLERRLGFARIEARPAPQGYPIQHQVELRIEAAEGLRATDSMTDIITQQIGSLRTEALKNPDVPLVALRLSVLSAIALEDALAGRGIRHDEIGVYRGLSSRAIRAMDGKSLVIGTSALEVGVDFKTTRLLFEAASASSFAQRLGRVGRHQPGRAHFFTGARVADALSQLGEGASRHEVFERVGRLLGEDDELSDFVVSPWGAAVALAVFDTLRSFATKHGNPDLMAMIQDAQRELGARLFGSDQLIPTGTVSRAVRRTLQESVFRGTSGAVEVFDIREKARRGAAELARYEVDLATFYRRARWEDLSEAETCPVVRAWGTPRTVSLVLRGVTFGESGLHAPSPDQLELRVEGQATRWEKFLRERSHVVGLFPEVVRARLSWRETCFDSDSGRVALLDDDALVGAFLASTESATPPAALAGCFD